MRQGGIACLEALRGGSGRQSAARPERGRTPLRRCLCRRLSGEKGEEETVNSRQKCNHYVWHA